MLISILTNDKIIKNIIIRLLFMKKLNITINHFVRRNILHFINLKIVFINRNNNNNVFSLKNYQNKSSFQS